jgi:hypothetical protein
VPAPMTTRRAGRSFPAMPKSLRRQAGRYCLAGASITFAGCTVMGFAQAWSSVPDTLYNAPLSSSQFVVFSIVNAFVNALFVAGFVALRRSGVIAAAGLRAVIAGQVLLGVCELASIALTGKAEDSTAATILDSGFGLASLLVVAGLLVAGVATVRAGAWSGWRRYAPLACGVLALVVIPLQFTGVLWLGVAVYALGFTVLGAALATDPAARPALQAA